MLLLIKVMLNNSNSDCVQDTAAVCVIMLLYSEFLGS